MKRVQHLNQAVNILADALSQLRGAYAGESCLVFGNGPSLTLEIIEEIQKYCCINNVYISDQMGINSNMKETLLMAVLGVARMQEMTANMPNVTGAKKQVLLGDIIKEKENQ